MPEVNSAFFHKVANRGAPPESFIKDMIGWAKKSSDSLFAPNAVFDIYDIIKPKLGPWESLLHRKAAMLETLRVLAGFESSWNWHEGKDVTNPAENSPEAWSAGPFQISANSINLDKSLKTFVEKELWTTNPGKFRFAMMDDHPFAFEYTARLLRINTNHNGPVKRREIVPWLQRDAVNAFMDELK